jgi:hypothetical protein
MQTRPGPLASFVIDALTVVALTVGLTGLYAVRLEKTGALQRALDLGDRVSVFDAGSVLSRFNDLLYGFFSINYYAYTDMSQNVLDGLVLAHGGAMYRDAVTNHMPGAAQLVALVLWPAGFANAVPGVNTATAALLAGSFATLLFQLACTFMALRMLAFSRTAAAVLSLVPCAYLAFRYNFAHPMSETLLAFAFVLAPVLLFRMLYAARPQDRVVYAVMLGGPFTFVCLNLGLTVAPANAFLALVSLAVVLLELKRDPAAICDALIRDRRSWLAYALIAALILLNAATVHISEGWFWVGDVNRVFAGNPLDVMAHSFGHHFKQAFRRIDPVGSRYPHLVVALALLAAGLWRASRTSGRWSAGRLLLIFVGLVCATAVLTQWRTDDGFKSVTVFGLTVGTLYLAFHLWLREWRAASDLWLVPLLAACLLQAGVLGRIVGYDTVPGLRHDALDDARVCRFNETENCRCIQMTGYAPQVFLWNDMRPCRSRFAALAYVMDQHPVLRRMMIDDVKRPDVAFWTYAPEQMRKNGLPGEAVDYLERQAVCFPLDRVKAICIAGS